MQIMIIHSSQLLQVIFSSILLESLHGLGNGTGKKIPEDSNRIVNGFPVVGNEFPYVVSYHQDHWFVCAGSIIHPYFILTAAHCFKKISTKGLTVLPNYRNLLVAKDQEKVYQVDEVIFHENTNRFHENDIALLKLVEPIAFIGGISKVKLPKFQVRPGQNLTVVGWGRTEKAPSSLTLNQVEVRRFPDEKCTKKLRPFQIGIMICAGNGNKDSCEGDSGGPLVFRGPGHGNDIQVGIVSFGPTECGAFAGVYTNVYHFVDWIQSKISQISF